MSFRTLRERKLLSQERVAEMSGLSLRTIQRLEAGHRVSYASLRALAATFEIDVDLLERELYAMNRPTDDFVEIPRWVRRLNDGLSYGMPPPSRRQAHVYEALAIACGIVFLIASFFVPSDFAATMFRIVGAFSLVCGYGLSVTSRIVDTYKAWPATETAWSEWRPARTLRSTVIAYAFVLLLTISFFAVVFWLAG